jgi:hypothetical protein
MRKRLIPLFALVLLAACNLPQSEPGGPPQLDTKTPLPTKTTAPEQTPLDSPTPATPTDTVPPTETHTPTATIPPTITPIPDPGTIEGGVYSYPFGSVPSLAIVAFQQEPPYNYSYIITASGTTYFSISSNYVIPGTWQVVAYDASGHAGGCPSIVTVKSNQTVNCDISDWGGSYPSKPASVPNP